MKRVEGLSACEAAWGGPGCLSSAAPLVPWPVFPSGENRPDFAADCRAKDAVPGWHTRGKTWEKCIVWLLLCHTMECEPSHYVVWQKANHRNRHFPMIRENALIPALPHQPKNRRKSCGVVHGQPEPDSWNQAAPGANHHGLVVEFVLEELLPLPPLEPFCELDC